MIEEVDKSRGKRYGLGLNWEYSTRKSKKELPKETKKEGGRTYFFEI